MQKLYYDLHKVSYCLYRLRIIVHHCSILDHYSIIEEFYSLTTKNNQNGKRNFRILIFHDFYFEELNFELIFLYLCAVFSSIFEKLQKKKSLLQIHYSLTTKFI